MASKLCKPLTRYGSQKDTLRAMYNGSIKANNETFGLICKGSGEPVILQPTIDQFKEGLFGMGGMGYNVRPGSINPCTAAGLKTIGEVHTHPGKMKKEAQYFSGLDLLNVAKGQSRCIIYRKDKKLKLKCVTAKKPIDYDAEADIRIRWDVAISPEIHDRVVMNKYFYKPCNVTIGNIKGPWQPWKRF